MKIVKESLIASINETPDYAYPDPSNREEYVDHETEGAYPFTYNDDDELIVGEEGSTHNRINPYRGKNSGRIFTVQKVLSFWKFPKTNEELVRVLKDLEEKLEISILTDRDYQIEIPVDKDNPYKDEYESQYIPINKYVGGYERSKEELAKQHVVSPLLKNKRKVEQGWGSNSDRYKNKRAWQMASLTAESASSDGLELNEGEKEFWNDVLDLEDRIDIDSIAAEISKKYGNNYCWAAQQELKKKLRPIFDFSDNFTKWLLQKHTIR